MNFGNSKSPRGGGLGASAGEGLHGWGHGWSGSPCSRSVEDVNERGHGVVGQEGEEKPANTA